MISVLDVPFHDKDIPTVAADVVEKILTGISSTRNFCISTTGAHGLVEASKNPSLKQILCDFYTNLPDGMPVVWIGRLKGAQSMRRCYGPDFFEAVLRATLDKPVNHFFCGGKESVAESLKAAVREKFSNNQVTGTYFPPFREMTDAEMQDLGQRIIDSNAHIVWIGISTPKQERFAWRLAQYTRTDFIITVGAAFDFHTGRLKQAPKWVQRTGLEWFFRLLMEPRRLYKRYFEIVPKFIWLNIKEFLHICISKIGGT